MPHGRPDKEWLHLRDAICMGDTTAVVDVLMREGIPDLSYDEMDNMLSQLKREGTDACSVVDEQEFKFAINNMVALVSKVDPLISFTTDRWHRVFDDMIGRASGRIAAGPGAHEPGHQQTWQEALMDARRWAVTKNQYALAYIDALLGGEVGERAEEYSQAGIYGSDRASAIRTQLLYVINNLSGWRGEEARAAKATLRAVSKGDLPAHYTRETPQGALEAMEERLVQDGQFRQRMTQQTLDLALSQMELRVGEIANAIRQMGTTAVSQETIEKIEDATEVIEEVAQELTGRSGRANAIRAYVMALGGTSGTENPRSVAAALQSRFPEITETHVRNAILTLPEGSPKLGRTPMIRTPKVTPEETPPISATRMEGGDLDELLGSLKRPERQSRNGSSWSRRYYPGLTEAQHDVNDAWFQQMLDLLSDTGILGVPNLQKAFNKRGEEVPFPGTNNPPNRVIKDPPAE
jgi:hypothetical protein